MAARLLDGVAVGHQIRGETAPAVAAFTAKAGRRPGLGIVLVGDNPASEVYVRNKLKSAGEAGLLAELFRLPATASLEDLLRLVDQLNRSETHDGILVQSPLPAAMGPDAERRVFDAIRPDKDVDGFHPVNAGRLAAGLPGFVPATPKGILELLRYYEVPLAGRHAVVLGRSNIVGRPMATLLSSRGVDMTVTLGHSASGPALRDLSRQADLLIAAIGRAEAIGADWIKPGAVVVDVGQHRVPVAGGRRVTGDVAAERVAAVASAITPVPGGVGPMTVAMVVANTVVAVERQLAGVKV
jgi:methylenetetrahydrofolate dehydrogenase (NADP+)/methenyltetrahydrofolate cyclohydrolase